ncbi:tannase/feruloyl esterase family alpha/beta hydrolase [Streptomyces sp. NPDC001002]
MRDHARPRTVPRPLPPPLRRRGRFSPALLPGAAVTAALTLLIAQPPAVAAARPTAAPSCADLSAGLLAGHQVRSATSTLVPATDKVPAHCRVDLVPERDINVRVTLPLSGTDGGTGGDLSGAWNGRVLNIGGGGYVGFVPDTTFALQRGEVGSSTDTGHNTAWCNATNPTTGVANAQPNCGLAGGGFVLDPAGKLLTSQVEDFIDRSEHAQTIWALDLAKTYYGTAARWNYWVGGSTGGRQGSQMAQRHGGLYDGFLLGYPAINWNRFIVGEAWPAVVVNELLGAKGLSPAKSDAANAAAVAACDGLDGVEDKVIAEPRRCTFDASKVSGLTPAEAEAVNLIWDGPRDADGNRLWGGLTRGTSFSVLLPGGNSMSPLIETYLRNWLAQDAGYDWRAGLTMENFPKTFEASYRKFEKTASTDSTDLSDVRRNNGKILYYVGTNDPLIAPFNSYNYQQRLFDRYGVQDTRSFVRSFYFPDVGHTEPTLTGTASALSQLLDALQAWTEHGKAPESFDQKDTAAGVERTICAYPDTAVGAGSDAPCKTRTTVPADLAAASRTAKDRR